MRFGSILSIVTLIFLLAGCSSSMPVFTTHTYTLLNTDAEKELISRIVEVEISSMGDKAIKAAEQRQNRLQGIVIEGDMVVVTTTNRGHATIQRALVHSREDARSVRENAKRIRSDS